MIHKIERVKALQDSILEVAFQEGKIKQYDVKGLFDIHPQFAVFKTDFMLFSKVKVDTGGYGVSWNDELDLDADTIWEDGILIEVEENLTINRLLAYQLSLARESVNMTQKQLAKETGIYQADISKIERGNANPSLSTLKRLADGMNMELQLKFVKRSE